MKAVLLPNMVEFPSMSMKRYAAELTQALHQVMPPKWEVEEHTCHEVGIARKILRGESGVKMASRLGRFVKYPFRASRLTGDVFHVLDHSHANLTLSLNPSRTVLTCHDCIPLLAARGEIEMPGASKIVKYSFPLRLHCIRRCAFTIAISESTKRDLMRLAQIPEEKIQVIYYGVNKAFTDTPEEGSSRADEAREIRARYNLPPDCRLLIHVGTRNRYKNTPALIQMMKRLREDSRFSDNVYLLRIGADFYDDEQVLAEQLGVMPRIVQGGRVTDDALLAKHYRAADVLPFPSIWEGFGWPPLEAMACGTPVVTSNVASLPEVVGDTAPTVAPDDHAGLADAVAALLVDSTYHAVQSGKALQRAAQFTWERCGRETLALYERIALSASARKTQPGGTAPVNHMKS